MNIKILAPALAAALLAAPAAFAQSSTAPAVDCKTGDLNCPTPLDRDKEAPIGTGRSATEVGNQSSDPAMGKTGVQDPSVDSSQKEIKKEGATPMEGNSNK
jgi:hypothetical protein